MKINCIEVSTIRANAYRALICRIEKYPLQFVVNGDGYFFHIYVYIAYTYAQ